MLLHRFARLPGIGLMVVLLTLGQTSAVAQAERTLGNLTGVTRSGSTVTLSTSADKVRVAFLQPTCSGSGSAQAARSPTRSAAPSCTPPTSDRST